MPEKTLVLPDMVNIPQETQSIVTSDGATQINIINGLEPKQIIIAVAGLLVAAIVFFIIKNYVSKILVANYKKSPRSAETAGWSLFAMLFLLAAGAALGILDATRFICLPYLLPIAGAVIVMLIIFVSSLLSKR